MTSTIPKIVGTLFAHRIGGVFLSKELNNYLDTNIDVISYTFLSGLKNAVGGDVFAYPESTCKKIVVAYENATVTLCEIAKIGDLWKVRIFNNDNTEIVTFDHVHRCVVSNIADLDDIIRGRMMMSPLVQSDASYRQGLRDIVDIITSPDSPHKISILQRKDVCLEALFRDMSSYFWGMKTLLKLYPDDRVVVYNDVKNGVVSTIRSATCGSLSIRCYRRPNHPAMFVLCKVFDAVYSTIVNQKPTRVTTLKCHYVQKVAFEDLHADDTNAVLTAWRVASCGSTRVKGCIVNSESSIFCIGLDNTPNPENITECLYSIGIEWVPHPEDAFYGVHIVTRGVPVEVPPLVKDLRGIVLEGGSTKMWGVTEEQIQEAIPACGVVVVEIVFHYPGHFLYMVVRDFNNRVADVTVYEGKYVRVVYRDTCDTHSVNPSMSSSEK